LSMTRPWRGRSARCCLGRGCSWRRRCVRAAPTTSATSPATASPTAGSCSTCRTCGRCTSTPKLTLRRRRPCQPEAVVGRPVRLRLFGPSDGCHAVAVTHGTDAGCRRQQCWVVVQGGPMPDTPTPWVGLAALAAMFLLRLLPDWLFEGLRTASTGCAGTSGATAAPPGPTSTVAPRESDAAPVLRGQLRRLPEAVHGARAAIDPGGPGAASRPGVRSAHSAEPNPIGIAAPLGRSCEVVSRAGAARALPGHQGEAS
jgi:hypothetical protein